MEMRCPVCNDQLKDEIPTCGSCPVNSGCSMLCCTNCGYQTVAPRSTLVNWVQRILGRKQPDALSNFTSVGPAVERAPVALANLPSGTRVGIAYLADTLRSARKLESLGLVPGGKLTLVQKRPTLVVEVDGTTLALETEVGRDIFVRPE